MARRKNTKRIDPRHFLNETVNRNDELEERYNPDEPEASDPWDYERGGPGSSRHPRGGYGHSSDGPRIDPNETHDQRKERRRLGRRKRQLDRLPWSAEVADEMKKWEADLEAAGLSASQLEEGLADVMAGPSVQASDMAAGDLKTAAGRLETLGELIVWLVDWIPNVAQAVGSVPEKEVGPFIKSLRVLSRVVGGPVKGLGHLLIKAGKEVEESPREVKAVLDKMLGGDWGPDQAKELAGSAASSAIAEE